MDAQWVKEGRYTGFIVANDVQSEESKDIEACCHEGP